jgi:SAM-dependent methyltransferase
MSHDDKLKWDNKYSSEKKLLELRPHSQKLETIITLTKGHKALDVACGSGRNSIFLAKNDFFVDACDISRVALNQIDTYDIKNITTKELDLDNFNPESLDYDLIIMTNFLDRDLINKISKVMKKNSIFFIETFMDHEKNEKKHSNPDFLLKKDELKSMFLNDFEIIDYDEYENESYELFKMMKQSIIVRKIK